MRTGDPCPECGRPVQGYVFALGCPDCGWDDRALTLDADRRNAGGSGE